MRSYLADSKEITKLNKSDENQLGDDVFGPLDIVEEKPKPVVLGSSQSARVNNEEMVL